MIQSPPGGSIASVAAYTSATAAIGPENRSLRNGLASSVLRGAAACYPASRPLRGGCVLGDSRMDPQLLAAARAAFPANAKAVTLGAPVHRGECHPEPLVRVPLAMLNRHGLIAGATGTGKTKTLQLMAEQLSAAGVPVFLADLKGDLSGLGGAGGAERARERDAPGTPATPGSPPPCPVEFLSLTGQARRPAARHRVVVRSAAARQGARPERDADQRARAGLQVLRRPRPRAARLRRPARRARAPDGRGRRRARRTTAACRRPRSACCCARWSSSSSRARWPSSASPSSISTTCCRSSATAAG